MALRYHQVLTGLESVSPFAIDTIHVVGGGARNELLCQMTADACGRTVVAGPVEATAIGNVMVQAIADGTVADLAEARDIIRRSCQIETYQPVSDRTGWLEAVQRFDGLVVGP